ncbi:MAG: hypothetical protein Q8909_09080, partial [Bacteroidota bacterium]|nr:hypothetical protein [Bacteroidota bacterium]
MKTNIKKAVVLLALIMSAVILPKQASAQQANVSFQLFYDQLSPYGQWVDYPNYGYVWIPDAEADFAPYATRGHWILTEYGWTWVSDYNWGWAPFHYGRWNYDDYYGWFWIPDNEWGPAWVTWRRANGYYGWAPMGYGISISISFGRRYDSYHDHWYFVRDRYFGRSDISRYYVNRNQHDNIIRNSSVINNTYNDRRRQTTYVSGPDRTEVQRFTGRKVSPVTIQENNRPGQTLSNGRLQIYRPQVSKSNEMGQIPAPSRVVDLKEVKRPSERKATTQPWNIRQQNDYNKVQQMDQRQQQQQQKQQQDQQQRKQQDQQQQMQQMDQRQQQQKQQQDQRQRKQQDQQQQMQQMDQRQQQQKQQQDQ